MQNINNIIFDYGNVIFELDFRKVVRAFHEIGVPDAERFFSHSEQSPIFDAFDLGEITAAQFRNEIRKLTGDFTLTDAGIDQAWNSLLVGVSEEHLRLLLRLKKRYRTFLLSNNNELHYQYIQDYLKREHGVESNSTFFEKDYYSHLMGMRKPNNNIFEYVLERHKLIPSETLFIDDSPQHLATARKLGIATQLIHAPNRLVEFFSSSGLDDRE